MGDKLPQVIRDYIHAYNAMDVDRMLDCLAEDIHFVNLAGKEETVSVRGKVAFRNLAEMACGKMLARQQTVTHAITVDRITLAEIDYTASLALRASDTNTGIETISLKGASLFEIEDGLILRLIDQS